MKCGLIHEPTSAESLHDRTRRYPMLLTHGSLQAPLSLLRSNLLREVLTVESGWAAKLFEVL
eukprot:m.106022 g.106022  ORF g.106022 m.106022 type:complete len:62 (-) comp12681_c0_seq2:613-798(-)